MAEGATAAVPDDDRRHPDHQIRIIGGKRITDLAKHDQDWVTVRQIAEYYSCPPRKVREWIHEGLLPAENPGGKRKTRVRLMDLRDFAARQRVSRKGL
jgi:excisionase family DNA binding protein